MWPFKKRDQKRDQGQQPPEVLSEQHEEPVTAVGSTDVPVETKKPPRLVEIFGVASHVDAPNQVCVSLRAIRTGMHLRMWMGVEDWRAITSPQEGLAPTHPLPHNLLMSVATTLGWRVSAVYITALVNEMFMAEVVIVRGRERRVLDARPCDALALAVRAEAPMWVADRVMEQEGTSAD